MDFIATSPGTTLAVDRLPGHRDTPVLLLHGGGQTRHAWDATASDLAKRGWPTIAADLRGHGDSAWAADGDYSIEAFSQDVAALVASCPSPPVLVGASLGGLSSLLALTEDPPPAAAGLVLVDVAHRFEPDGARRIIDFMSAWPDGFASPSEASEAVSDYLAHRGRPVDSAGLLHNLRRRGRRWYWHWDPAILRLSGPFTDPQTADLLRENLARAIACLELPTLLTRGAASDIVTPDIAAEFAVLAPHAEVIDVADARHMVAGDSNELFTSVLLDFLERHFA